MKKRFIVTMLIGIFAGLSSCFSDSFAGDASAEDSQNEKHRTEKILLPAVFRTPETGAGIGIGLFLLEPPAANAQGSKVDGSRIGAIYTEKNQFVLRGQFERYSQDHRDQTVLSIMAQRYPDSFFGIGPDTRTEDEEKYTSLAWDVRGRFLHEIKAQMHIGLQGQISDEKISSLQELGFLDRSVDQNGKVIFGVTPVKLAGFGVIARWDSRNDVEDPDSGIFAEIDWLNRNKALGGNYDFNTTSIDLRGFFPILDTSRMRPVRYAGQILVTGMDGDPPFQSLAQLGGRDRLRGYFLGRYRERQMVLVQNEIRIPLSERWGTVIYAAAGNVGHNWQQISRTQAKPAWGAGGRYRIANNQRVNIRLDFAWTRESNIPSYYLSLAEAF